MPEYKGFPKGFFPEIIEVGLVFVKNQEIIDRFSSYVQPTHFTKLTERCKSFLHIEQNQVNEGITLEQLVQRLGMYKNSTIITWGNMDMKVLRQCCQKIRCRFLLQVKKLIFRWSISAFWRSKSNRPLESCARVW